MTATEAFIQSNLQADVNALALRMRQYPDVDAAFALRQIEGFQRARHKLPQLAAIPNWHWPARLSLEQCSSESTAEYKAQLLQRYLAAQTSNAGASAASHSATSTTPAAPHSATSSPNHTLWDLTGGLGVDCFYLSPLFREVHYVERQPELCALAEHNFALAAKPIQIHNAQAEQILSEMTASAQREQTTLFLDPARRSKQGGKVFRLQDCEPDITALLPTLKACASIILLKLSPMLDLAEALRALGGAAEVHIVAVRGEVKELLILLNNTLNTPDPLITCVNLETDDPAFSFHLSEEKTQPGASAPHPAPAAATPILSTPDASAATGDFLLIEPNAAILKAGAYHTFAQRYSLTALAPNSHLFVPIHPDAISHPDTLSGSFNSSPKLGVKRLSRTEESPVNFRGVNAARECCSQHIELRNQVPAGRRSVSPLPARTFLVHQASKDELQSLRQANIICRNYPLTPDQLKHKLRLKDGGPAYLIATRIGTKPTIFIGTRQFLHINH